MKNNSNDNSTREKKSDSGKNSADYKCDSDSETFRNGGSSDTINDSQGDDSRRSEDHQDSSSPGSSNHEANNERGNNWTLGENGMHQGTLQGTHGLSGGQYSSGLLAPCGGGCSPDTLTTQTVGPVGGFGGQSPNTPVKNVKGSVITAPSSATSAGETADSTMCCSLATELHIRSQRGYRRTVPSLRRQYQMLQSQSLLLFGSASIGFILFLVFVLPFVALVSLALTTVSLAALVPVAFAAVRTRYEMELQHPLGLLRYLPDSIRVLLMETTLHDYMTDTTFMMENRHLLLYFIPGLDADQLMGYINQLPPRHRDVLLQPGLGRLMPSIMNRLVRTNNSTGVSNNTQLENGGRGDISTSSGLTFDRDEHGIVDENGNDIDAQVTLMDAIATLRQTVMRSIRTDGGISTNATTLRSENIHIEGVPPNTTVDLRSDDVESLDANDGSVVEAAVANGGSNATLNSDPAVQNVSLELPASSTPITDQNNNQNQFDSRQDEYDLEARLLSDAASAAAANFSVQASAAATEAGAEVIMTTSSWFIRAGTLTGIIAGGGGIVAAMFAQLQFSSPLTITLGSMRGDDRALHANNSVSGGNSVRMSSGGASYRFVHGLFATSAIGFLSAGISYLIRNQVRASIASNRENKETINPKNDKTKEPDH